jgi:ATP-dependent DNA ligase
MGRAALVEVSSGRYLAPVSMRILPPGFVPPCLPTKAECPPSGELWLHEIKHDGFQVIPGRTAPRCGSTAGPAMT